MSRAWVVILFFFSSRRRHTRLQGDWSSDVCSSDLHRRLLGNGHCTRPLELDCRFQTICEGCRFYQTGPEFVTILRRQRDDAVAHADPIRTTLYDELVNVIDDGAID